MSSPLEKSMKIETESTSVTPLLNSPVNTQSYLTEGLEGVEHRPYHGITSFTTAMQEKTKQPLPDTASQYISFAPVTQQQLTEIEQIRDTQYKRLRFTYLSHEQTLFVKIMPGVAHEVANRAFAHLIIAKSVEMGFSSEIGDIGGATFTVPSGAKEANTTFRPLQSRPYGNPWPTLVIECGVTQSPPSLVAPSNWWFAKSKGEVKYVIPLPVPKSTRSIHLQKWEARTEPNHQVTREHPDAFRIIPVKVQDIDITGDGVNGAPLRIEFAKLMLREQHDREGDLIFDTQELAAYGARIWAFSQ